MSVPRIYDWGIAAYQAVIHLAAWFLPKARLWVQGRKGWEPRLQQALAKANPGGQPRIWIHCASLGEFEQGRPVIEALRHQYPKAFILLSFFSPSGYVIRKDYAVADHVCYLPADTPRAADQFVALVAPQLVIFVKYEFWLRTLQALHQRGVPVLLISAIFRPKQIFFSSYGAPWRAALHSYRHIFVQDAASAQLLQVAGIANYTIAGDTRVDRVLALAAEERRFALVETFVQQARIWIAGSTWPADEALIAQVWRKLQGQGWKLIIAPHQVSEAGIRRLMEQLAGRTLRYSHADEATAANAQVLIIDNVGMLAALYRYADIAYIGGGFGTGIHNTLEPMACHLPLIFGPRYRKFAEAVAMVQAGAAISVDNGAALEMAFTTLTDPMRRQQAAQAAQAYLALQQGASARILQYIKEEIFSELDESTTRMEVERF